MKIFGYKSTVEQCMERSVALILGMKFRGRTIGWDLQGTKIPLEATDKTMTQIDSLSCILNEPTKRGLDRLTYAGRIVEDCK
jgi:hypothetical protein